MMSIIHGCAAEVHVNITIASSHFLYMCERNAGAYLGGGQGAMAPPQDEKGGAKVSFGPPPRFHKKVNFKSFMVILIG